MKIRADEHVSLRIVEAIRLVCLSKTWDLSHVREHHGTRTQDETWLPAFASEGGTAILSGDGKMLKRPHQIMAVGATGLVSVILSVGWSQARRHEQAANIVYWWPRIESAIANAAPGDCIPVPFKFDASELTVKKINYGKAEEAVRRHRTKTEIR